MSPMMGWQVLFALVGMTAASDTCAEETALLHGGLNIINRQKTAEQERTEQKQLAATSTPGDFACPVFCSQCCQAYTSLTGWVSGWRVDRSEFKCTFPEHSAHLLEDAVHQASFHGRECTPPEPRSSDPRVWKVKCRFSDEERDSQAWRDIGECQYDPTLISFENFLGPSSCAVTSIDAAFAHVTGVERFGLVSYGLSGYFSHDAEYACQQKAGTLHRDGLLENVDETEEEVRAELCPQLQADLDKGRMDPFTMALWVTGTFPETVVLASEYPKPTDSPRHLNKYNMPGWPARTVAYETLPEDVKQPWFGTESAPNAVMCTIRTFRSEPVDDAIGEVGFNTFGSSDEDPHRPRDSNDLINAYYDRYTLYQSRGVHFDIPAGQLLTDATLEKFVFQAIGAHHIEIISADGHGVFSVESLNPMSLGGCAGVPAGNGCPHPLQESLAALPDRTRPQARYAVRMEGLYDDLPRREGMGRWGSNAFFDEAGHILAIQYNGETKFPAADDPSWNYFKFVFRSSLVSTVTVLDHLVGCHTLIAGTLAVSTFETLEATDNLRLLLMPHTHGTININEQAATKLFAGKMVIHRSTPFALEVFEPEDGSTGSVWAKATALRLQKFEDIYEVYHANREDVPGAPEIPFFEDGILFYRAVQNYVSAVIEETYGASFCSFALLRDVRAQRFITSFFAYSDPATPDLWPQNLRNAGSNCASFKALLTECIFTVTGFHRHVGQVADFFRDLTFAGTAWVDGEDKPRPKQGFLTMFLAAATKFTGHKMDGGAELIHMFEDQPALQAIFESFALALLDVQAEVEVRNQRRVNEGNVAFQQMQPSEIEWSVMI